MPKKLLDGLIGKLEKELNLPSIKEPTVAIGGGIGSTKENLFKIGANPFNPSATPTLRSDPLNFKRSSAKQRAETARKLRQQAILRRHAGGTPTGTNEPEDQAGSSGGVSEDQDEDLKTAEDFVDENKFKTMDWTEPDGSKTTLKFDDDGTLIGKTKVTRPSKTQQDLKDKLEAELKNKLNKLSSRVLLRRPKMKKSSFSYLSRKSGCTVWCWD